MDLSPLRTPADFDAAAALLLSHEAGGEVLVAPSLQLDDGIAPDAGGRDGDAIDLCSDSEDGER